MKPRSSIALLVPFLVASLGASPRARANAGDVTAANEDAQALLREGVARRRDHQNAEALAAFQRADALSPSAIARAQIGLAEQALARWVDAERDLRAALDAGDDPWITTNREALEGAARSVATHLAWLEVDVNVAQAEVRLDGRPLGRGEVRVAAGTGMLEGRADGYAPDTRRVEIANGAHARVAIVLTPLPAPASVTTPAVLAAPPAALGEVPPPRPSVGLAPVVLGGVGIAALGAGAYFGVRTFQDKSDRAPHCSVRGCDAIGYAADADARTSATLSNIAFTAGAACVGAAVVWLLLPRAARPSGAALAPIVGRDVAGLAFAGAL